MIKLFINLLFPYKCLLCKGGNAIICEACETKTIGQMLPRCDQLKFDPHKREGQTMPVYSCSIYDYEGHWAALIKRLKYKFSQELSVFLARQLYRLIMEHCFWVLQQAESVAIVPVPLAYKRSCWRGFNQSELLAKELSKMTGIKIWRGIKRKKDTGSQVKLKAKARRKNLVGAFVLIEGLPEHTKIVIIIDDVVTTGSTLREVWSTMQSENPDAAYISLCLASRLVF